MKTEVQDREDTRGQGFPQLLHDRARAAGSELYRLLISLAIGGVGLFFLALTGKADPPLSLAQRLVVLFAVISMAVAALSGIACLYADARRYYFWACALQATDELKRLQSYKERDRWFRLKRFATKGLIWLFVAGILASAAYLGLRLKGKMKSHESAIVSKRCRTNRWTRAAGACFVR